MPLLDHLWILLALPLLGALLNGLLGRHWTQRRINIVGVG